MFGQFLLNTNEILQLRYNTKCQLCPSKVGHLNKAVVSLGKPKFAVLGDPQVVAMVSRTIANTMP
jgi:hypothetical protein